MFWQPIRNRVQSELIQRGHCVACTRSLAEADRQDSPKEKNTQLVTCSCRRVYIYNKMLNSYRRAVEEELPKQPTT